MSDSTSSSGVAGRYAVALFEIAEESGSIEGVEQALGSLKAALAESADLRSVIKSPIISREEQAAAMAKLCEALGIGAPVSAAVGLMAQNRRLFTLPQVIAGFDALLAKKRGVQQAEVVSAKPLTDAQRAALEDTIKSSVGADVALDVTVDESLIGGLVVRVGSKMIDTSIRSKLASLQTLMKEAG